MSSDFRRSLPARPDLAQQKALAKELLEGFRSEDRDAVARIRQHLPDKSAITLADAQFVLAREYGFTTWAALAGQIRRQVAVPPSLHEQAHDAFQRRDAKAIRRLLTQHADLRARINDPVFPFDSPAIVCFANDPAIVTVLLEFGADPNRRSDWWAGGFHPLHSATDEAAARLLSAGAVPDACAAAHLDRPDLLAALLAADPGRVHERGGDGQTPLHFARSRAMVDLLLEAGADLDARDVDHRSTAAEWMLERRRGAGRYALAESLVERGASTDIFLAAALGLTDRARQMLETDPGLLALRTGQGVYGEKLPSSYHIYVWTIGTSLTPLDVAAQFEHPETVAMMSRFATPVGRFQAACRAGNAALARAIHRQEPGLVAGMAPGEHRLITDAAWAGDADAVELMLELGFDPRTPGHDGGTALHCAAWQGSAATVEALLRHPLGLACVPVADAHYGATPLGWCCHGSLHGPRTGDHARIALLLLRAGARPGPDTMEAAPAVAAQLSGFRR
jgi:ankyrin repeat protein